MTEVGLLLLYAMAPGGRVHHRIVKESYRPGIPQAALCGFQPRHRANRYLEFSPTPWAWAGIEQPRAGVCDKCLSESQLFEAGIYPKEDPE